MASDLNSDLVAASASHRRPGGADPEARTGPGSVPAFGSRPFRDREAAQAIDSAVAGLRLLAEFGGGRRDQIDATIDVAELVDQAAIGLPRFLPVPVRPTYHALFVAIGEKCRAIVDKLTPEAGLPHVTDAVVSASLRDQLSSDPGTQSARLLRMAVAAELSTRGTVASNTVNGLTGTRSTSHNPLSGLVDLYAMGAVLKPDGSAPRLAMANGRTTELAWTGNPVSRNVPGHLRPALDVDLTI